MGKLISSETAKINSYFLNLKYSKILKNDVISILKIIHLNKYTLTVRGVDLNLRQSISEVLVMLSELKSYKESLFTILKSIGEKPGKVLITGEQKSPHAMADADVAKNSHLDCIQIMQCDQEYIDIPYPIVGDAFITDTYESYKNLCKCWPKDVHKLHYLGRIKGFSPSNQSALKFRNFANDKNKLLTFCMFLQGDDFEINCSVLDALVHFKSAYNFIIKPHPRDKVSNYSKYFNYFEFIKSDIRKENLYYLFDCGITFPSAVTLELEFKQKPYIFLNFGKWASPNIRSNHTNNIISVCKSKDIQSAFDNILSLYNNFLNTKKSNDTIDLNADYTVEKILSLTNSEKYVD